MIISIYIPPNIVYITRYPRCKRLGTLYPV